MINHNKINNDFYNISILSSYDICEISSWSYHWNPKSQSQGPDSIKRCCLASIGKPIVEIRWSYDRLISTMGFPVLVRQHLYIESGPWSLSLEVAVKYVYRARTYLFITMPTNVPAIGTINNTHNLWWSNQELSICRLNRVQNQLSGNGKFKKIAR